MMMVDFLKYTIILEWHPLNVQDRALSLDWKTPFQQDMLDVFVEGRQWRVDNHHDGSAILFQSHMHVFHVQEPNGEGQCGGEDHLGVWLYGGPNE